jgi:membrane protein DedA with SNARE-associated domain
MEALHALLGQLVDFIGSMGYWGIYILTFIESTFVPLPSELVVIPAGYLAHQGLFNFWLLFLVATVGTLSGAVFNYWLGITLGRKFLLAYGKYMFISEERFKKVEEFFKEHGAISTFSGRFIPGLRHLIPIPAGIAKMDFKKFCIYTTVGGGGWMLILLTIGYLIGDNKQQVQESLHMVQAFIAVFLILLVVSYGWYYSRNKKGPLSNLDVMVPSRDVMKPLKGMNKPASNKKQAESEDMIYPATQAMEMLRENSRKKPATRKKAAKKKPAGKKPTAKKPAAKKGKKRGGKK